MKWNKYKLKTTTQAEDFVSGVLMELGISGIQVEDNVQISQEDKEKQFIDYLADLPEDDGTAYISFYTEEDDNAEQLLDQLREKLKEAKSLMWAKAVLKKVQLKMLTGLTIGRSILSLLLLESFLLSLLGKKQMKSIRV